MYGALAVSCCAMQRAAFAQTVRRGMKLLNNWNSLIIEQSAWKYHNPVDDKTYKDLGGRGEVGRTWMYAMSRSRC